MALRCFLFSSDEGTADLIRQVLTGLGVEGEFCSEAVSAGERIAKEVFQLVIIDWDQQPEGNLLLTAARERKAAERPLTLAIVSDDISVPKALQAGANSILRRPILLNQVKDTLTTARDLLRARFESAPAAPATSSPSAPVASTFPAGIDSGQEKTLRGAEFLQSTPVAPSGQFETESDTAKFRLQSAAEQISPLKDLEPMAAPLPVTASPPEPPRTLEELLKSRGVARPGGRPQASPSVEGENSELVRNDQAPSYSSHSSGSAAAAAAAPAPSPEREKEPALFSAVIGETEEPEEPKEATEPKPKKASRASLRPGKRMFVFASILAGCAIVLAPQAPWHSKVQMLWSRGRHALQAWLNPQPVITPTAPTAHEDFGRAGDEYKLPTVENIPDATTDPSQIRVVPAVDPTGKKPNNTGVADQPTVTDTQPSTTPAGTQAPTVQVPDSQAPQTLPVTTQPADAPTVVGTSAPSTSPISTPAATPQSSDTPAVAYSPVTPTPAPPKRQPAPYVPPPAPNVPSSLKSQMATTVPDASGNKAPEAAMPSIEPVDVSEPTERALLTDQPPLDYPAAAGTQQGTVILQVLVGRDGSVQDAKFLQGSLAFARVAIEGVKQWKFKPYIMNGRPVSVQTKLTVNFKPGQ